MKELLLSFVLFLCLSYVSYAQEAYPISSFDVESINSNLVLKDVQYTGTSNNSNIQIASSVKVQEDFSKGQKMEAIVNDKRKETTLNYTPIQPIYSEKKTLIKEELKSIK